MKYEISEQVMKNIQVFLGRVQLQGNEVQAFNQIAKVFAAPIVEGIKKEEIKIKKEEK